MRDLARFSTDDNLDASPDCGTFRPMCIGNLPGDLSRDWWGEHRCAPRVPEEDRKDGAVKSWHATGSGGTARKYRPRLNDLMRGKLGEFSLDALVNLATVAGLVPKIQIEEAA
jgi:hypothetical protein